VDLGVRWEVCRRALEACWEVSWVELVVVRRKRSEENKTCRNEEYQKC
jgi:hypothetical protein